MNYKRAVELAVECIEFEIDGREVALEVSRELGAKRSTIENTHRIDELREAIRALETKKYCEVVM